MNKKILHEIIDRNSREFPGRIAVIDQHGEHTYIELFHTSNAIGASIFYRKRSFINKPIGVFMSPGFQYVASCLGISKAGGAFFPLDISIPDTRLLLMIREAAPVTILSDDKNYIRISDLLAAIPNGPEVVKISDVSYAVAGDIPVLEDHTTQLYILFTSGSTGTPKGIVGIHQSLSHFIHWEISELGVDASVRGVLLAPVGFDVSLRDIFIPLVAGGILIIPSPEIRETFSRFVDLIEMHKVNLLHIVPSMFRLLTEHINARSLSLDFLKWVLLAGEPLFGRDINSFRNGGSRDPVIINLYGPSETTLAKLYHRIPNHHLSEQEIVPLGIPIWNTLALILNKNRLCEIGEEGEIHIKTPFATAGYLNDNELTKEKFIQNPLHNDFEDLIFKTGDRGCYLPDKSVSFNGRIDQLVKVRGNRVEILELESYLAAFLELGVTGVVAFTDIDASTVLACFYTRDVVDITPVKNSLKRDLPSYMHPSFFFYIDKLPLIHNGKLDRKILSHIAAEKIKSFESAKGQWDETTSAIVELYQKALYGRIEPDSDFFSAGGHSLAALRIISGIYLKFGKEVSIRDVYNNPTPAGLADLIRTKDEKGFKHIVPLQKQDHYPLSSAQRRIWFLDKFDEQPGRYIIFRAVELKGAFKDVEAQRSMQFLVDKYEILRTTFVDIEGTIVQSVKLNAADGYFTFTDLLGKTNPRHDAKLISQSERNTRMDLQAGPLIRLHMVRIDAGTSLFLFSIHHIISDDVTIRMLSAEFFKLYRDLVDNVSISIPDNMLQYRDFSGWQNNRVNSEEFLEEKKYWTDTLAGELPFLNLPVLPVDSSGFGADKISFVIEQDLVEEMRKLMQQQRVSTFVVLLSAWATLLYRYTTQTDMIVGTPSTERDHPDLSELPGLMVNTLPLRITIQSNATFADVIETCRRVFLGAQEHSLYPFDQILEDLSLPRDPDKNPLFKMMLLYRREDERNDEPNYLFLNDWTPKTGKFDLTITWTELPSSIHFEIEYRTGLFAKERIESMGVHFKNLLRAVVSGGAQSVEEIDYLSKEEKQHWLEQPFVQSTYPKEDTLLSIFDRVAAKFSGRIALQHGDSLLTYDTLNKRSQDVCDSLKSRFDVIPGELIAVSAERSFDTIVTIIGIVKAGAAYLPIDTAYPGDRVRFILADSGVRIFITNNLLPDPELTSNVTSVTFQEIATSSVQNGRSKKTACSPEQLAYMIYTSGSTGLPKGVRVTHKNVVRLFFNDKDRFHFNESDSWLLFHSLSFDFSVWEMWGALLFGARLVLPETSILDPGEISAFIKKTGITVLNQTPTAFKAIVGHLCNPQGNIALRYVIFGGEALRPAFLLEFHLIHPGVKLVNMYGITETTVHVTYKEIGRAEIDGNHSNIGSPIPTTSLYLLDKKQQLVPFGAIGEIAVGGEGVAKGYHNRNDLTKDRFIDNPFGSGKLYLSGDEGWALSNGEIIYLGRNDKQVKIRGYRIELGEIEHQLTLHPGVNECVVITTSEPAQEPELLAYFVSSNNVSSETIRKYLAGIFPRHMMPHRISRLSSLPHNINGKFDLSLVKEHEIIEHDESSLQVDYSPLQKIVEDAWRKILNTNSLHAQSDFFGSGGDSIKAIRLVNEINSSGYAIKVRDVFLNSTLAAMTALITDRGANSQTEFGTGLANELRNHIENKSELAAKLPGGWEDIFPMADIQKGMVFHQLKDSGTNVYHDRFYFQFDDPAFDHERFVSAFRNIVGKHAILRTSFDLFTFGEPAQIVYKDLVMEDHIFYNDISDFSRADQQVKILLSANKTITEGYDIKAPGLFRLFIYKLSGSQVGLLWMFHHAILDGWSNATLFTELSNIYFGSKSKTVERPELLKTSYKDFVEQELEVKKMSFAKDFWKEYLSDAQRTPVPFQRSVAPGASSNVAKHTFNIEPSVVDKIDSKARAMAINVGELGFAAFTYLIRMLSATSDLVIGKVTHLRPDRKDGDKVLGCFLNTLPVRLQISGRETNNSLISKIKCSTRKVNEFNKLSLMEIAMINGVAGNGNPFFDIVYNYIDFHVYDNLHIEARGDVDPLVNNAENTNTHFDFQFVKAVNELHFGFSVPEGVYSAAEIDQIGEYFVNILHAITSVSEVDLSFEAAMGERALARLEELNNTEAPVTLDGYLPELLPKYLTMYSNHVLKWKDESISFGMLHNISDAIATRLTEKEKLVNGDYVTLLIERSPAMVAIILALAKAGITYVTIEPGAPPQRITTIHKDSSPKLVIATTPENYGYVCYPIVSVSELMSEKIVNKSFKPLKVSGDDIAYVIYTSGSTGVPKGVQIRYSSFTSFLSWALSEYASADIEVVYAGTSYCFDLSMYEIFFPIISGKSIRLLDSSLDIPTYLDRDNKILVNTVPSVVLYLLRTKCDFKNVLMINIAGEVIPDEVRKNPILEKFEIRNLYGPSEDTTYSSCYLFRKNSPNTSVGRPISNTKFWIVDSEMNLLPPGVVGEIYISGDGLAAGYLNNQAMTEARFKQLPIYDVRVYQTGDHARWNSENEIDLCGRRDQQVKIRGYRIELEEIEKILLKFPDVTDVIVTTIGSSPELMRICAGLVAQSGVSEDQVRNFLREYLPDFMIPSSILFLDKIPTNVNGKKDYPVVRALFEKSELTVNNSPVIATELETVILEIWKDVLRNDHVRINDNFFKLGGNSILVLILINRLNERFGNLFAISDFFNFGTCHELAKLVGERRKIQFSEGEGHFESMLL
jgi:tyrocidine synthetase III